MVSAKGKGSGGIKNEIPFGLRSPSAGTHESRGNEQI